MNHTASRDNSCLGEVTVFLGYLLAFNVGYPLCLAISSLVWVGLIFLMVCLIYRAIIS